MHEAKKKKVKCSPQWPTHLQKLKKEKKKKKKKIKK